MPSRRRQASTSTWPTSCAYPVSFFLPGLKNKKPTEEHHFCGQNTTTHHSPLAKVKHRQITARMGLEILTKKRPTGQYQQEEDRGSVPSSSPWKRGSLQSLSGAELVSHRLTLRASMASNFRRLAPLGAKGCVFLEALTRSALA